MSGRKPRSREQRFESFNCVEANGQLKHTYILFASDNGYHQGQHRLVGKVGIEWTGGKRTLYEEDVRVPFIIRGPGIAPGTRSPALVANHDIASTLVDLANAEVPVGVDVDGVSLVPLLTSPQLNWREAILLEKWNPNNKPTQMPTSQAIRTQRYKYIALETGEEELYDLDSLVDPYEMESKHDDPNYQAIKMTLRDRLNLMKICVKDGCFQQESAPLSLP